MPSCGRDNSIWVLVSYLTTYSLCSAAIREKSSVRLTQARGQPVYKSGIRMTGRPRRRQCRPPLLDIDEQQSGSPYTEQPFSAFPARRVAGPCAASQRGRSCIHPKGGSSSIEAGFEIYRNEARKVGKHIIDELALRPRGPYLAQVKE